MKIVCISYKYIIIGMLMILSLIGIFVSFMKKTINVDATINKYQEKIETMRTQLDVSSIEIERLYLWRIYSCQMTKEI